jgi:hypothetical protein
VIPTVLIFLRRFTIILKKPISIFFLTVYLFSVTEAGQLVKLPVLFQHFAEHKIQDHHIGILPFLDIHYMHGSPKDKDYSRDMQLPFKKATGFILIFSANYVPASISFTILKPLEIKAGKFFHAKESFLLSSPLSNIWQPPKAA